MDHPKGISRPLSLVAHSQGSHHSDLAQERSGVCQVGIRVDRIASADFRLVVGLRLRDWGFGFRVRVQGSSAQLRFGVEGCRVWGLSSCVAACDRSKKMTLLFLKKSRLEGTWTSSQSPNEARKNSTCRRA